MYISLRNLKHVIAIFNIQINESNIILEIIIEYIYIYKLKKME